MIDLFKDILPSITYNKNDVLEDEKEYNAYMVNKALSYYLDTVLYANEMNKSYFLDNRLQYDYLRYSIRPMKRFAKWVKPQKNDKINMIMEYFGYSMRKAEEVVNLISDEQMEHIKKKLDTGGTK